MANNPLFNMLGGNKQTAADGGFAAMMQEFAQFRQGFRGDARQQVQELLNSGKMTQAQYDSLSAIARQIMPMLK